MESIYEPYQYGSPRNSGIHCVYFAQATSKSGRRRTKIGRAKNLVSRAAALASKGGGVVGEHATVGFFAFTMRDGFEATRDLEAELLNDPLSASLRIAGTEWFYPDDDMIHRVARRLNEDRDRFMRAWKVRCIDLRQRGEKIPKLECMLGAESRMIALPEWLS